MRRVAVLGGVRLPFCRSHTAYAELSNLDMLTAALTGLIDRFSLHGAHIDEVVGGAVVTHAKDWNLAREAVIGSALADGIVANADHVDAGVIFGTGFAPFTGGPLNLVQSRSAATAKQGSAAAGKAEPPKLVRAA